MNDALNDAFGQRQVSTIYAQANQYRVVLEAHAAIPQRPSRALAHLRPLERRRASAAARALAKIDATATAPLAVSHQDQFPA